MATIDRTTPPKPCAVCGSLFAPIDPVIDVCSRECARLLAALVRGLKIRTARDTEFPAQTKAQHDDEQARLRRALPSCRLTNRLRLREMAFLLGSQSGAACIAHAWESGVRPITHEYACRVRSGSAPQALADLRNAALNLIRSTGQKPRPAREAFAEQKWKAIRLVTAS